MRRLVWRSMVGSEINGPWLMKSSVHAAKGYGDRMFVVVQGAPKKNHQTRYHVYMSSNPDTHFRRIFSNKPSLDSAKAAAAHYDGAHPIGTKATLARALDNPLPNPLSGATMLEAGLIVGGAALMGVGWWLGDHADAQEAVCLSQTGQGSSLTPAQCHSNQSSMRSVSDASVYSGFAAMGGGLGGVAAGKKGGAIGAVLLPAAWFAYNQWKQSHQASK